MLTKEKSLRAIRQTLTLCFIVIVVQSCNNHKEHDGDNTSALPRRYDTDSLNVTIKKLEKSILKDTAIIGDIHIAISDTNNFYKSFKNDPGKFYYSQTSRTDFFMLHDYASKKYYLFGAENGGCLSCFSYVELIDNSAFKMALLPEEIRDTVEFKPHKIYDLKFEILDFPYLKFHSSVSIIESKLKKAGFKIVTKEGKNKMFKRTTIYSIISVFIIDNEFSRMVIQLNNDI